MRKPTRQLACVDAAKTVTNKNHFCVSLVICFAKNFFQARQCVDWAVHVVPNPRKEDPVTKSCQSGAKRVQTVVAGQEAGYKQKLRTHENAHSDWSGGRVRAE